MLNGLRNIKIAQNISGIPEIIIKLFKYHLLQKVATFCNNVHREKFLKPIQ